jgi:hypothetical protein
LAIALCLSTAPSVARADRYELQLGVAPSVSMSMQQGERYVGSGAMGLVRYGLYQRLAIEATVGCDVYQHTFNPQRKPNDESVHGLLQDSLRCAVVPALAATFGRRLLTSVSAGVGYGFNHRHHREWVSVEGSSNGSAPSNTQHDLVAQAQFSLGARFWTVFSVAAFAAISTPLGGDKRWLGVHGGVLAAVSLYP